GSSCILLQFQRTFRGVLMPDEVMRFSMYFHGQNPIFNVRVRKGLLPGFFLGRCVHAIFN
ncbi:MAG: hypothetical protein ACJ700_08730, partial [Nitrososphaera sp.]